MRSYLLGAISKLIGVIVVAAIIIPWDNSTWYVQKDPAFVIRVRMENDVPVEGFGTVP